MNIRKKYAADWIWRKKPSRWFLHWPVNNVCVGWGGGQAENSVLTRYNSVTSKLNDIKRVNNVNLKILFHREFSWQMHFYFFRFQRRIILLLVDDNNKQFIVREIVQNKWNSFIIPRSYNALNNKIYYIEFRVKIM